MTLDRDWNFQRLSRCQFEMIGSQIQREVRLGQRHMNPIHIARPAMIEAVADGQSILPVGGGFEYQRRVRQLVGVIDFVPFALLKKDSVY